MDTACFSLSAERKKRPAGVLCPQTQNQIKIIFFRGVYLEKDTNILRVWHFCAMGVKMMHVAKCEFLEQALFVPERKPMSKNKFFDSQKDPFGGLF